MTLSSFHTPASAYPDGRFGYEPVRGCIAGKDATRLEMSEAPGSILIVDDEQLNLDMLSRRLRRSGFVVAVASSGKEALDKVRQQMFDLVLLDQMMPDLSGSDVLRMLRNDFSSEMLPVIMVTAVAESDKIADALEHGANDYITKPVDFAVAVARIRSQLARKRAEDALRQSEERYALAAEASQDGLWDWNLVSQEIYYSPRWKRMIGLPESDLDRSAEAWFSRVLSADRQATRDAIDRYLQGAADVLQCSYRIRHANGSVRWMSCRAIVTRDDRGLPVRLAGSQNDVSEEKTRDALTGLPNRLPLLGRLECAIEQEGLDHDAAHTHALLFLDLDGFKTINDSLGHMAGDQLLRLVADRLQLAANTFAGAELPAVQPLVARMGGDEFAILLEGEVTRGSALAFADFVQQSMSKSFDLEGRDVRCVFSVGIALADRSHTKPEDLLRDADLAMYTAKQRGRGGVIAFEPEMHHAAGLQLALETDIWMAVDRDELAVVYQPKVDLVTGLTYGVEALVRWNHPTRGLLQPGVFIPIAERTGAIVEIGKWTLREACEQVRRWHEAFPLAAPLELSANLSPREFKQENLAEEIGRIIAETGFPASSLHLEITEGVLFGDIAAARTVLFELKKMGIGLDIDDFGSGYCSLRYLRELPFDSLKIDRYFTANLDTAAAEGGPTLDLDPTDSGKPSTGELIGTIITMAHHLGLQVIAEGIETAPHSARLQKLGCRFGQGFYFSKPVPPEAMQELLIARYQAMRQDEPALLHVSEPVLLFDTQEVA